MQGRLDSPLTDRGVAQALAHGRLLEREVTVDAMWVSPAGRTRASADGINRSLKLPLHYSEHLLERDCGTWSGRTVAEIAAADPTGWQQRQQDPIYSRPGGGENLPDLMHRYQALQQQLPEVETLALVTHGVMAKAILAHHLNLDAEQVVALIHPNEVVYRLDFNDEHISASHYVAAATPAQVEFEHDGLARPGLYLRDGSAPFVARAAASQSE